MPTRTLDYPAPKRYSSPTGIDPATGQRMFSSRQWSLEDKENARCAGTRFDGTEDSVDLKRGAK